MPFSYIGVDHVGIAVADLDSAVLCYTQLGFVCAGFEVLEDRGIKVALIETGSGRIELMAPLRSDSEISGFLDKRGPGMHHLCVAVDSIDQTLEHMNQTGVRMADTVAKPGAHNSRVAFVHPKAAGGVLLELVEHHS